MSTLSDILSLPNGARFYRADLHIHSFGSSHDVKDVTMIPDGIVTTAVAEGLDVVAVADHNEIINVEATITAANGHDLLVIPAVELSTADGHLLCYLPTLDALKKYFASLSIVDHGTSTSRCQNSILDCLSKLAQLSGFGVLAHVDGDGGFDVVNPGMSPHKVDVLCHKALLGIELKNSTSPISYSDSDPDPNRANAGRSRIRKLVLGSSQYLARLLNSDAHTLNTLGKNAQGMRKVSRVKMNGPSFAALRIAFEDSDARVRIEDQIPATVPHVVGIHLEGGFLDGQHIHFSPNLNCIIGGRGTGKSTTFEAVRCLTGEFSDNTIVDSDVWPSEITLFWRDQAGQVHSLHRSWGGELLNLDDPVNGPDAFVIESYGQGETARISKEANTDPIALLRYLDRFVDIADAAMEEEQARDELLAVQGEIEKATTNVELIPQYERMLSTTQQQLAALKQAKAEEVIELQRKLAEEREVRSSISRKLTAVQQDINALSAKTLVEEIEALAVPNNLAVGTTEFEKILQGARTFESETTTAQALVKASYKILKETTDIQLTSWKAKEAVALKTIEDKRKALESQNIKLDMAYIQKLAKDEAELKTSLTNLRMWKPHLIEQKRKYGAASQRRWAARERIATTRDAYGKAISRVLRSALSDLIVSLKFSRSSYSPDAEKQIIQAMVWRTIQVPRAALLIEKLTMPGLLSAIDKRNSAALTAVTTDQGAKIFDNSEAERLITQLSEPAIRFALERCVVYDVPRLTVTKVVTTPGGPPRNVVKDFSKLSLGQQQSVLLALMLSSNSSAPLIIDQPEDNLDAEFIYHSLVPVLRLAKERRQVIIVTHNANIAVLGDAEQIIVLKSTSDKGMVVSRGSIDESSTSTAACSILEGAKEAFERRARIYGVNQPT
jgi:DNA repair ATPase RecN